MKRDPAFGAFVRTLVIGVAVAYAAAVLLARWAIGPVRPRPTDGGFPP